MPTFCLLAASSTSSSGGRFVRFGTTTMTAVSTDLPREPIGDVTFKGSLVSMSYTARSGAATAAMWLSLYITFTAFFRFSTVAFSVNGTEAGAVPSNGSCVCASIS
ncbi:hypothetical protein PR002_g28230 [Phytophthora rubi]|uniref:Uncharacterized protein n=1 Tax=Phytophthora rubi TaxID=129364 RepID=A0A6A3HAK6_9STRA|nr:hypothetical protein PR002_g28230 [Phytophthora rubi]